MNNIYKNTSFAKVKRNCFIWIFKGKEGRAAARNSDYALARFYHLERLLLFHGRMFYYRLATLVQYFFYKVSLSILLWKVNQNFFCIDCFWTFTF